MRTSLLRAIRSRLGVLAIITIGVVPALTTIASAATVPVVNSSFEDPHIGVAGVPFSATGWSSSGTTIQLVTPSLGPGVFNAEDGVQAAFTGNGLVTQTLVPITPGASYTLSAYVSLLGFPNGAGGNYTLTIGYEPNGTFGTYTQFATGNNTVGPLGSSWLFASITGVAPLNASGALAITLGGDGEFWDNVSVTANTTPLPSTWLMLLSGFFGFGVFAYRGTKKRSAALAAA